jgi:hypothetical protein
VPAQARYNRSVRFDALAPQHYKVVTSFPGYNALPDPIGRPPVAMARRSTPTTRKHIGATSAARTPTERSSIVHSSLYLPEPVYEALRKIAFDERAKIHDIVLEGIDAALRRRGYPSVKRLKGGKGR